MEQQPPQLEPQSRRPLLGGFLSFGRWSDMARIRWYFECLFYYASLLFIPKTPVRKESFENTIARFQLTEAELKRQANLFLTMAVLMLFIFIGFIVYAVIMFKDGGLEGGIVALAIGLFVAGLVFRYHFWYVQIKKRKLGCTFNDWLRYLIGR